MKQKMFKLLKKDWETPDGDIIKGEWREFSPYKIKLSDRRRCERQGFMHLLNGDWLWVTYPDTGKKPYFVHINTIDKVITMDDNDILYEWDGVDWKYKEVAYCI